jgi:hypothetical protein
VRECLSTKSFSDDWNVTSQLCKMQFVDVFGEVDCCGFTSLIRVRNGSLDFLCQHFVHFQFSGDFLFFRLPLIASLRLGAAKLCSFSPQGRLLHQFSSTLSFLAPPSAPSPSSISLHLSPWPLYFSLSLSSDRERREHDDWGNCSLKSGF